MPGNKVWRIDVAAGKATAGAQLKDVETIWSLASAGNTVYAGTGPSGKVFAIAGGNAKEIFDTDDKRVTAITVTSDGAVWFGTSERALVFRYDPKDGKTRAMADFAGNEVTAIAAYRDGVVVGGERSRGHPPATRRQDHRRQVEDAEKPTASKGQAAKLPEVGSKPGADKDPSPVTDMGRKGAKKGKGALFRIAGDGRLDQLHALTATYFTSVAVATDGGVFAGAADKGRVYMVDAEERGRDCVRRRGALGQPGVVRSQPATWGSRPTTRRRSTGRPGARRRRSTCPTRWTRRRSRSSGASRGTRAGA